MLSYVTYPASKSNQNCVIRSLDMQTTRHSLLIKVVCRLVYRSRYFWSVSALCVNRCLADIERVIRLMAARLDCYSHHRLSLIAMMVMRSLAPCAVRRQTLTALRPQTTASSSHFGLKSLRPPATLFSIHFVPKPLRPQVTPSKSLHRSHSVLTLLRPQTTSSPNHFVPKHSVTTPHRPHVIQSRNHCVHTPYRSYK